MLRRQAASCGQAQQAFGHRSGRACPGRAPCGPVLPSVSSHNSRSLHTLAPCAVASRGEPVQALEPTQRTHSTRKEDVVALPLSLTQSVEDGELVQSDLEDSSVPECGTLPEEALRNLDAYRRVEAYSATTSSSAVVTGNGFAYPPAQRNQIRESWDALMRWSKVFNTRKLAGSPLEAAKKIVVFGGGSFGTAMGCALARQKPDLEVVLLVRDPYLCKDINLLHENTRYLKVGPVQQGRPPIFERGFRGFWCEGPGLPSKEGTGPSRGLGVCTGISHFRRNTAAPHMQLLS